MQKGFAPILILIGILIIAVIGGAYYFVIQKQPNPSSISTQSYQKPQPTSTPDQTANWGIYTATGSGLLVKYPPSWNIQEKMYNKLNLKSIDISSPDQQILIDINFLNGTFEQFKAERQSKGEKWDNTQLGNIPAIVNVISDKAKTFVFASKDINLYIMVGYLTSQQATNEDLQFVYQALSTFKLTN